MHGIDPIEHSSRVRTGCCVLPRVPPSCRVGRDHQQGDRHGTYGSFHRIAPHRFNYSSRSLLRKPPDYSFGEGGTVAGGGVWPLLSPAALWASLAAFSSAWLYRAARRASKSSRVSVAIRSWSNCLSRWASINSHICRLSLRTGSFEFFEAALSRISFNKACLLPSAASISCKRWRSSN